MPESFGGFYWQESEEQTSVDCIRGGDWVSIHLTFSLSCPVYWAIPLHKFTALGVTHRATAEPTSAEEVLKHSLQRGVKRQPKICSWPLRPSRNMDPREIQLYAVSPTCEGGGNLEYPSLYLHAAPSAHNVHPVLLSALPAFPSITDNLLVSECTYYRTVRGVFVSTTR